MLKIMGKKIFYAEFFCFSKPMRTFTVSHNDFSVQQLQHIPIEMGSPIVQCSVADPYILIMSDEGQLMMLTLKQDAQGGRLVLSKPLVAAVSRSIILYLYNCIGSEKQNN